MFFPIPPLPPHFSNGLFQGYVTVNEINELYSQLGVDPTPVPLPTQAQSSPDAPSTGLTSLTPVLRRALPRRERVRCVIRIVYVC